MRSSMRAKEMTIESLMKSLEATEEQGSREKIPDENTRKLFIKNRMRLWKNRIIELLDFRE